MHIYTQHHKQGEKHKTNARNIDTQTIEGNQPYNNTERYIKKNKRDATQERQTNINIETHTGRHNTHTDTHMVNNT